MRMLRTVLVGSALAALVSSGPASAQTIDNFVGTWKLNVAKSKCSPGPCPKDLTVTIEKAEGGFKLTAKGTNPEGGVIDNTYTGKYDGTDVPVTGQEWDAISTKLMDANTRHTVRKKGGKEYQVLHSVVAKDGKSYTTTVTGMNAKGEKVNSTMVYEKQ